MLIARYTTNASGVLPTFNTDYVYEVSETESNGVYTVEITSESDFSSCSFNGLSKLLTVDYLKVTDNVTNMGNMFYNCKALTSLDVSNFDTSNVTTMEAMFQSCYVLTSLDVSNFDTSNVTTMASMFYDCNALTSLDVSNFDTSNVTKMSYMFHSCKALTSLDVSSFDTSNVGDMRYMFHSCNSLTSLDASNWDTSKVTDMRYMFYECKALTSLDLSNFYTSRVTNMGNMFYNCKALTSLDLSNFITSSVTSMYSMFYGCNALTSLDLSNWNTSKVTNMRYMFHSCNSLTSLDASNWDTSKVTDMAYMFYGCKALTTLNVGGWPLNDITQTAISSLPIGDDERNDIYSYCYFTVPSGWNLIKLYEIAKYTCNTSGVLPTFNSDYTGYFTIETDNGDGTYATCIMTDDLDVMPSNISFSGQTALLTVDYLKVTSNVTNMNNMFQFCSSLTQLDVSNWDTSKVTSMYYMFNSCSKLTQLDVSNWDTSSVINMGYIFNNCSSLTVLDVSNFDTSKVTNMSNMFNGCSSLKTLDVSNFDTSNVTTMDCMFQTCSKLTTLDLSNFDTGKVNNMGSMFNNCSNLRKIKILNTNFPRLLDVLPTRTVGNPGYLFTYKEIPNEKNWVSYICEDFNTKFELPQPLRRVGDVSDRLYWDYNKGHYCIEKNINEDYTILDTPIIIDLSIKNRISMVYDTKTRFNTNTIKTQVELSSPIYKIKPLGLSPNVTYTLRFICLGVETVTIDLGGHIIKVNPIDDRVDIQIQTLETLTNEYISIYGNGGTITNVMLFEGTDIGEVGYIDNITSVGKLQKDGSYKINLMTSPLILRKGNK